MQVAHVRHPHPTTDEGLWSFTFESLDEGASHGLAADLARLIRPGDCLALDGSVGMGKSTFARALLRSCAYNPDLEVPSPTFTLVQTYELEQEEGVIEISHFDLYRIGDFEELYEIGLDESWQTGAALIEWPDRAEGLLPKDTLWVQFATGMKEDCRCVTLSGYGTWKARLERLCDKRQLLIASGWGDGLMAPLIGDLSPRRYDRITRPDQNVEPSRDTNSILCPTAILMDMPKRAPGPVLSDGRRYDLVAHRVTELAPMISICAGLEEMGLRVPTMFGADPDRGLLLWEDFGGDTLSNSAEDPIAERYLATSMQLAKLHEQPKPSFFDGAGGHHTIPSYSRDAFFIELDVFLDHYWPHVKGAVCPLTERQAFQTIWEPLIDHLLAAEQGLVLRDVQDPNCFWLADAPEGEQVGFIDFQDCLIGPSAYDLAALATDARVTISNRLETDILSTYWNMRLIKGDYRDNFYSAYCLCVAQRTMKNLGAFARAADQWNKASYLDHVPRSLSYLDKALSYPLLADLKKWYETHQLAS